MNKHNKIYSFFLIILFLLACLNNISSLKINSNSSTDISAEWTIMVYLDGDNNLEYNAIEDFLEMSDVGSNSEINIVVQFDRAYYYDYSYGNWDGTKRFYITNGMTPTSENCIMDLGETNMGNPDTLVEFVDWTTSNYPADKYCLIFWDHGEGWKSDYCNSYLKNVCHDDTDTDYLNLDEISMALNEITNNLGKKIDIIGFDACLMGMLEVAYQLKDYANYMTASEQTEPVSGWNYADSLNYLKNFPDSSASELGAYFVNNYNGYGITLSTILLDLDDLMSDINILVYSLMNDQYRPYIVSALENVEKYDEPDNIDLYHYFLLLSSLIDDSLIKSQIYDVLDELDYIICSNKHDYLNENSYGLSIYFPYYSYDSDYNNIIISEEQDWDFFLLWYFDEASNAPPSDPEIEGPNAATSLDYHEYSFNSIDPEFDEIYYLIDWGDQENMILYGPFISGEPFYISYSWIEQGAYIIRAKAIDKTGAQSNWNSYPISMPKFKNHFKILKGFDLFFEKIFYNLLSIYK